MLLYYSISMRRFFHINRLAKRHYYYGDNSNQKIKNDNVLSPFLQSKYDEYKSQKDCEKKEIVIDFSNKLLNIQDEIRCVNIKIDNQNKEIQKIVSLLNFHDDIKAINDNVDKQNKYLLKTITVLNNKIIALLNSK